MSDGQQRIVDQAKAQGNAWDTGVVPGHLRMEQNSTLAEEVKVTCYSEVTSERRVDDEETHRRKSSSGRTRLEPDRLAEDREDRSSFATSHLHGRTGLAERGHFQRSLRSSRMRREAHVRFLGGSPPRGGPLPACDQVAIDL